jgi:hypothetical protein
MIGGRIITKIRIALLKRKARSLLYANRAEMDTTDCGFRLRDTLSGGRLSRREAEARRLVAEAMLLELEID